MAVPDAYRALNLGEFNIGAQSAVAFLNPLAAQIDALMALGLGPYQAALKAQLGGALAAQQQLSLTIGLGDFSIIQFLKDSIAALVQLQAQIAVNLGLGIPPISVGLTVELGSVAAAAAALKVQVAGVQALIKAAVAAKVPAVRAATRLNAALNAGPFFAISFSDVQLQDVSAWLNSEVSGGGLSADSQTLAPTDQTYGVLIFGTDASFQALFDAIIDVPT